MQIPIDDIDTNTLHRTASSNSQKWSDLLWVSGGLLDLDKCYFYAFPPSINYKTNKINYRALDFGQGIKVQNPNTGSQNCILGVSPQDSKCTLGVVLSPDGNGYRQLQILITKATKILGKFHNSSLPQQDKLIAVTSVIEPSLIHPLVNMLYKGSDIRPLDSITSQMKCTSLGLNMHFPRAILHGPSQLGGMRIPSTSQKKSKDRLNYFLCKIRGNSSNTKKLDKSIIYTQMEVGFFTQFFSLPFELIGHLAADSFCVQLWSELEPKGLILQSAIGCTWTPAPLCEGDIPLNLLAIQHYDSHGSSIINRCRMFLHLISIYIY